MRYALTITRATLIGDDDDDDDAILFGLQIEELLKSLKELV